MGGHTVRAGTSDGVADDSFTTLTDRGAVEAKLQGRTAAVTAGKYRVLHNYTTTLNKEGCV